MKKLQARAWHISRAPFTHQKFQRSAAPRAAGQWGCPAAAEIQEPDRIGGSHCTPVQPRSPTFPGQAPSGKLVTNDPVTRQPGKEAWSKVPPQGSTHSELPMEALRMRPRASPLSFKNEVGDLLKLRLSKALTLHAADLVRIPTPFLVSPPGVQSQERPGHC